MSNNLIRIIGIGNPLMGDDGLGIKTIQILQQRNIPEAVELIDGGCGGLKLLPLFTGCNKLIIIDAADFAAKPGEIKILGNNDLHRIPHQPHQQSGHHFSLPEILQTAQRLNPLPDLSLYLMQIKSCHPATVLTAEVEAALPSLIRTLLIDLGLLDGANSHQRN